MINLAAHTYALRALVEQLSAFRDDAQALATRASDVANQAQAALLQLVAATEAQAPAAAPAAPAASPSAPATPPATPAILPTAPAAQPVPVTDTAHAATGHHPDITLISPRSHSDITRISPRYHLDITHISPQHHTSNSSATQSPGRRPAGRDAQALLSQPAAAAETQAPAPPAAPAALPSGRAAPASPAAPNAPTPAAHTAPASPGARAATASCAQPRAGGHTAATALPPHRDPTDAAPPHHHSTGRDPVPPPPAIAPQPLAAADLNGHGHPRNEQFEVREAGAPFRGLGLFARLPLANGRTVLRYEGEELTPLAMATRYGVNAAGQPSVPPQYVLYLPSPPRYVDASNTPGALSRYINHANSKKANVRFTEAGSIRTVRRVNAGQQLLANYGRDALRVLRQHGLMPPAAPRRGRKRKRGGAEANPASP